MLLRKANDFPDYLKIETTLKGFGDLTDYLDNLPILTPITESTLSKDECIHARNQDRGALLEYIREEPPKSNLFCIEIKKGMIR